MAAGQSWMLDVSTIVHVSSPEQIREDRRDRRSVGVLGLLGAKSYYEHHLDPTTGVWYDVGVGV